jgi:beta-phosphoglucomutase-like phosphatase (HAD superfamily)
MAEKPTIPGTNIQGIIFDCDGTIADTMPLHWKAWQVIKERHGIQLPKERFYSLGGVPSRDILKLLKKEQGLTLDPLIVAKEKEQAYQDLLAHVGPIDCVLNIARQNFGRVPLAVASGGTKRAITAVLNHLGILLLFQAVVTHEDVEHQKPAPDIYLEAARRIGVLPQFCRAYEDTDLGLEGIRAAGMEAIDVRTLLPAECKI